MPDCEGQSERTNRAPDPHEVKKQQNNKGVSAVSEHAVGPVYLLEKLERFHSSSSVWEEQPQILLRHILSVETKVRG